MATSWTPITIKSLLSTAPTFARSSVAYDPDDGSEVLANVPRYVAGADGSVNGAIFVEEGTTNLLTANQATGGDSSSNTTGFTPYIFADISYVTTEKFSGAGCIKVITPGASAFEGVTTSPQAATGGLPYSGQVRVKAPAGAAMRILIRSTSQSYTQVTWTATGGWDNPMGSYTPPANCADFHMNISTNSQQAITFYVDNLHLEQKAYSTSFQLPGAARVIESMQIPRSLWEIQPPFSVAIWFYASNSVTNRNYTVFSGTEAGGFAVQLNHAAFQNKLAGWAMMDGVYKNPQINIANVALNAWNFVVLSVSLTDVTLHLVNAGGHFSNSVLGAFTALTYPAEAFRRLYIGAENTSGAPDPNTVFNGPFDDFRIFNRVLTSAEVSDLYAGRLSRDVYRSMTYHLQFNGSLTPKTGTEWSNISL